MDLSTLLTSLRRNRDFMPQVAAWERIRARPPQYGELQRPLSPPLAAALHMRGIERLFTHQAAAVTAVSRSENIVVATATSSGKSLCYTIPVIERLLERPSARALYLFPTKALAHDQAAETRALINAGNLPVAVHSYDGDTPSSQRSKIKRSDGILISNPDMLHAGILPYHTSWRSMFANLQFIILDEIHAYRGVFGSHVGNVIRRLRRICEFYGASPQFICSSATIANPKEHAERLVDAPFTLIDESQNGAPRGEKQFILYNPPIVDEELGLRASLILAAKDAAWTFLAEDIQTIVFARARQTVELLLSYLQDEMRYRKGSAGAISGYRGGYLPQERREIERGLRDGSLRGVAATNALELGIDIGELDAAVIAGYPGSIASTWQQAGRAGRRNTQSAAILIAGNSPLEQYICRHPRYLFGSSPEHALIDADNPRIVVGHLRCAAYEIPFRKGELFGGLGDVDPLLEILEGGGELHETRQQYHWVGDSPPSVSFSLRVSGDETVLIHNTAVSPPVIIGEIDLDSVPFQLYEGAIYMHMATPYLVDTLDWDGRIAHARPVDVDYYTRASVGSSIRELNAEEETKEGDTIHAHGDLIVVSKATGYRKIKKYSHETLGFGEINLPEMTLDTAGYWMIIGEQLTERLFEAGVLLRPNNYGPNWQTQRLKALQRDNKRCRTCGSEEAGLHVHHIRPFRTFEYIPGVNENYRQANVVENLASLCPACHRRAEMGQQSRSALSGFGYAVGNLAPLFLMCDPGDIQVSVESRSPLTQLPTIVVYERAVGVGLSRRLFDLRADLLRAALELIDGCRCRDGCPACVGPPADIGPNTKTITRQLLQLLTQHP